MVIDKRHTASFDPNGSPSAQEGIRLHHLATSVSTHTCKNGVFLVFLGHAAAPSGLKLGKLSSCDICLLVWLRQGGSLSNDFSWIRCRVWLDLLICYTNLTQYDWQSRVDHDLFDDD
jgi:hypothetical protein